MSNILAKAIVALIFDVCIGSLAFAQDSSTEQTQPPAAPKAASPAEPGAETPASKPAVTLPGDDCKGLDEKLCRKNNNCYWIIPKIPDKDGQVPVAYCKKRGTTKTKPTTPPAAPSP